MNFILRKNLLQDKRVIDEINKHLWIESQKAGESIGLERAAEEWVRLYARDWVKHHMPEQYRKLMIKKHTRKKTSGH